MQTLVTTSKKVADFRLATKRIAIRDLALLLSSSVNPNNKWFILYLLLYTYNGQIYVQNDNLIIINHIIHVVCMYIYSMYVCMGGTTHTQ